MPLITAGLIVLLRYGFFLKKGSSLFKPRRFVCLTLIFKLAQLFFLCDTLKRRKGEKFVHSVLFSFFQTELSLSVQREGGGASQRVISKDFPTG